MAVARSIDWIEVRLFAAESLFGIAELLSIV
jgi:hypothetical protein